MLKAELITRYLDRLPVDKELERQWLAMFLKVLEVIHSRAFGETGVREQTFVTPGTPQWIAQYLPPLRARTELGARVRRGRCAYLVSRRGWNGRLDLWVKALGVSVDPSNSALLDAMLHAVHECRHRAQLRNGVRCFSTREKLVDGLKRHFVLSAGDDDLLQWFGVWARSGRRCSIGAAPRAYEIDARLIEGAVLTPWFCVELRRKTRVEQFLDFLSFLVLLEPP